MFNTENQIAISDKNDLKRHIKTIRHMVKGAFGKPKKAFYVDPKGVKHHALKAIDHYDNQTTLVIKETEKSVTLSFK